jgi:hypothetical protein
MVSLTGARRGGRGAVDVRSSEKISEAAVDYDSQARLDAIQSQVAAL